jgi:hypothetical protein
MRAKDFVSEKRLDPELLRLYKLAKAKFPMYDEDTALLKYLQVSSRRSDDADAKEMSAISQLKHDVKDLDKRVSHLEKEK